MRCYMRKIYHLSALKREFDGYDRWEKARIEIVDFENNINNQKETMESYSRRPSVDISYHQIEIREATKQEIETFLNKKLKNLEGNQKDIKSKENQIKGLENHNQILSKEISEIHNILIDR